MQDQEVHVELDQIPDTDIEDIQLSIIFNKSTLKEQQYTPIIIFS